LSAAKLHIISPMSLLLPKFNMIIHQYL
jgi:hypothetical protein